MTIEFHNPAGDLNKKEIAFVRDKLIDCYHALNIITRAEVYFNKTFRNSKLNFTCIINIDVFEHSFYIRSDADSYETSIIATIQAVEEKVDKLIKELSEPPDEILSTVKI